MTENLKQTSRITPYMCLKLIGAGNWEEHLEEVGSALPSGIIEVTSPITGMKETYFLSFQTDPPREPVDHCVLESIVRMRVKTMLKEHWQKENASYEVTELIREIGWDVLLHRFDIITYEYCLGDKTRAFELLPGTWVSYYLEANHCPSPAIGRFIDQDKTRYAHLVTLSNLSIEDLGPPSEVRMLVETRAREHFNSDELIWDVS